MRPEEIFYAVLFALLGVGFVIFWIMTPPENDDEEGTHGVSCQCRACLY